MQTIVLVISALSLLISGVALFLSPLRAAKVTIDWTVEREQRAEKMKVFTDLYTKRVQIPPDPSFFNSLMLVPVVFHKNSKVVRYYNEFCQYENIKELDDDFDPHATLDRYMGDRFARLLDAISNDLGYPDLDQADFKAKAHGSHLLISDYLNSQKLTEVATQYFQMQNGPDPV